MFAYHKENFFSHLDLILPEIKRIKLYNMKDHPENLEPEIEWPGYRSENLLKCSPSLFFLVLENLKKTNLVKGNYQFLIYIHLRTEKDEKEDFIHEDKATLAGLVYLNKTNLNSGTHLYDENDNIISDFKYVQNRLVMYSGQYRHCAYGHFGDTFDNGRTTLNIFAHKK